MIFEIQNNKIKNFKKHKHILNIEFDFSDIKSEIN